MLRRPRCCTLFPYTTLFRSQLWLLGQAAAHWLGSTTIRRYGERLAEGPLIGVPAITLDGGFRWCCSGLGRNIVCQEILWRSEERRVGKECRSRWAADD